MRKSEWSRTSTHPYDFMAYTGFWKYSYIYVTILDSYTLSISSPFVDTVTTFRCDIPVYRLG